MKLKLYLFTIILAASSVSLLAQNDQSKVFEDFPWLSSLINIEDCEGATITIYKKGVHPYVFVKIPVVAKLFYEDGEVVCTNGKNHNCTDLYSLSDVEAFWSCDGSSIDEQVIEEDPAGCTDPTAFNYKPNATIANGSCIYERDDSIFERYPGLRYRVNINDCEGEKLTVYTFEGEIEIYRETNWGTYIMFKSGGSMCRPYDEELNFNDCLSIEQRDISDVIETWSCDGVTSFNETIQDLLKRRRYLEYFSNGLNNYGEDLTGEGSYTVFAPNNAALEGVYPNISLFEQIDPPDNYTETLNHHIVEGLYLSEDLFDGQILTSITGRDIVVTVNSNGIFINGAKIIIADLTSTNGVAYQIDKVFVFDDIYDCTDATATNYNVAATKDNGSCIFGEEDEIFSEYPWLNDYVDRDNCNNEKITVYNFVVGIEIYLETEEGSYIFYDNGFPICTAADEVLFQQSCPEILYRDISNVVRTWECGGIATNNETIDDLIKTLDGLNFFSITQGNFGFDLSTEGPFTVFAANNDALTNTYPNVAVFGFAPPPEDFPAILRNHVVPGIYLSTDLFDGQILTTIDGNQLEVTVNELGIFINDARLILADKEATNGVVHVVDDILEIRSTFETRTIDLTMNITGWNLISFDVSPADKTIQSVFEDVIQTGNLEFVASFDNEAKIFDPNQPAFLNTLTEVEDGFGYWVKVANNDALQIEGTFIDDNYRKPLDVGWNLIAYPPDAPQESSMYFNDLISNGELEFVSGFDNGVLIFDPDMPSFLNTLQQMENGFGYWVKINNLNLRKTNKLTNVFSFINGTSNLPVGEKVNVLCEAGKTLAILDVINDGYLMTSTIYGDDPTTTLKENISVGESLSFSWNNQILDSNTTFKGDYGIEKIDLDFKLSENLANELSVKAYPVPTKDVLSFEIIVKEATDLLLQVFDNKGSLVQSIDKTSLIAGKHIVEHNVAQLAEGIYSYQIITSNKIKAGKFSVMR